MIIFNNNKNNGLMGQGKILKDPNRWIWDINEHKRNGEGNT